MPALTLRQLCPPDPLLLTLRDITRRIFQERNWPAPVFAEGAGPGQILWTLDPHLPPDGFRIESAPDDQIRIAGGSPRGILYGMGRFLRQTRFTADAWQCSPWRGTSIPRLSMRGIYFATHFHNFYQDAPIEKVERYVEDLALMGYNALNVWFDMHHYQGLADPAAQCQLQRLRDLLQTARRVGMAAGIGVLANEGYRSTPRPLRATPTGRAHYGVEICPDQPGGVDLILANLRGEFEAFREVGLDFMWLWPYDQGGCACPACAPWGSNGMLRIGESVARLFRSLYPKGQVIYSTWLFDYGQDQGEWVGLQRAFAKKPDWADYLLADSHERFPRFPLEQGVPGGLPLLNFPEISMWGMFPWGGFGANPLIRRFTRLWGEVAHLADGGFPYSEGIFEDLNKAAYAHFYWTGDTDCRAFLEDYFHFQCGGTEGGQFRHLLDLLESNHAPSWMTDSIVRKWGKPDGALPLNGYPGEAVRYPRPQADANRAAEALALCRRLELSLPEWGRQSWRWRLIALRAQLDHELLRNGDQPTDACQAAFRELQDLYAAQNAEAAVAPPLKDVVRIEDSNQCDV